MSGRKRLNRFTGSVKQAPHFNPDKDAGTLHSNLRGIGNDEASVISILSSRTNAQRQEVARSYFSAYERNLIQDLKIHSKGDFQTILLALFHPPRVYDATCLNKAIKGLIKDPKAMTEILMTRTPEEIKKIKEIYLEKFSRELTKDIEEDCSGEFRKFLLTLATTEREDFQAVSAEKAKLDATSLQNAVKKHGEEMSATFISIFCSRSFAQLNAAFYDYKKLAGRDITKTITSEFSTDLKDGLKAICEVATYPPDYFADRLYRSMKGAGTDDKTLIRVVVTRSEIDMIDIKKSFAEKHGKSLEKYIEGDTSGSYKKLLLALVYD
uniref:annexin A4-like isoform X1 n=1 Tax=Styela clava TaxID=7725 RepID=UPI00193AB699|nr:annexin A4-like isoform X1 [Styela clava]